MNVTVAESPETLRIDRSFRQRLLGGALCWAVIGGAQFAAAQRIDWYPSLVAILALCAAVCTGFLAVRPSSELAYRWAGTLAVGALILRSVTVVEAAWRAETSEFVWLAADQVAITALLAGTYAWSWLHEVKTWHRAHRLLDE